MREAIDLPPLWDEIQKRFKLSNKPRVLFAWGNTVYNPSGIEIPQCLWDHEIVHGHRQGKDVEGWWRRYMDDPVFRLNEEIPAHIAELESLLETGDRNERRRAYKQTAQRLAAGLYGGLISPKKAKALLKDSQKYRNM